MDIYVFLHFFYNFTLKLPTLLRIIPENRYYSKDIFDNSQFVHNFSLPMALTFHHREGEFSADTQLVIDIAGAFDEIEGAFGTIHFAAEGNHIARQYFALETDVVHA